MIIIHEKSNKDNKKVTNRNRADFLNEYFFPDATNYATKEVGNWVLVRQWQTDHWIVAIWPKDKFQKSQEFYKEHQQSLIDMAT